MPEEELDMQPVHETPSPPVDTDTPPVDTDTPPADAPPPADDNDPARFTKRINEKTFEMHEQRRRADAAEAALASMQAEAGKAARPGIPDLPDPYDVDFEGKMKARDEAVVAATTFDAQQQQQQFAQQQQALAKQQAKQRELVETVATYSKRATKLGVAPEKLQVAGNAVAAYGIAPDLEQFILHDASGPLITTYLAENPGEIETLRGMHPTVAAVRIATEIVPKAKAAGGTSTAPAPVDTLGGGGAPPSEPGPAGATYE
ncbi:MAG: hypothetical protein DRQ42_08915 [Gammaproteobacteria bacterium]|nr:MAG: hypothetical protein DRQ42_08915 [Gammaproteobacteria bacterium]